MEPDTDASRQTMVANEPLCQPFSVKCFGSNASVLIGKDGKLSCGRFTGDLRRLFFSLDKKRRLQYCDPSSTGGNAYGSAHC
jgi:hypothetical protein